MEIQFLGHPHVFIQPCAQGFALQTLGIDEVGFDCLFETSSSPCATASKQTMRNIVMSTYQEIIMSHYSLLTTLNNTWWTCPQTNFKRLIGLKITSMTFTYHWQIQGRDPGSPFIFRQNWDPTCWKLLFWRSPSPPPPALSKGLDDWPLPLSQGLDRALHIPRARLSISLSVPLFYFEDIL